MPFRNFINYMEIVKIAVLIIFYFPDISIACIEWILKQFFLLSTIRMYSISVRKDRLTYFLGDKIEKLQKRPKGFHYY